MRDKFGRFIKGHRSSRTTEFKKGGEPWNAGIEIDRIKYPTMGHFKNHTIKSKNKIKKAIKKVFPNGRKGKDSPSWKGGTPLNKAGYKWIYSPNHPLARGNYVFEHRLVVEMQIKRYLLPEEVCHHLNEIKIDNRPENLMAFINESVHQRFHKNPSNVKPSEIVFDGRKINLAHLQS